MWNLTHTTHHPSDLTGAAGATGPADATTRES
jgi:hypothetical protein